MGRTGLRPAGKDEPMPEPGPPRAIVGYHRDEENHWVARLACGHNQHVRHDPPWILRPWVTHAEGRRAMLGHALACLKCARGEPPDPPPAHPEEPGGEPGA